MTKPKPTQPSSPPTETDLPEGWVSPLVRDVLDVRYGKGLPEKNRRYGPYAVYGSNGVVGHHDEPLTAGPTIILGRKGTVGAVHYSRQPCWPIDTTYFVEEVPGLDMGFLYYALSTLGLSEMDTSSAIPGLNREDVFAQVLPLAPLPEQKRIVAKLEALLERVNAARDSLAKIPPILKRFRQSILSSACSGRLTEDWREGALPGRQEGVGPRHGLGIPDEWDVTSVGEIASLVTSGSRGWARYYAETGAVFIRAQDINTDRLCLTDVAHVRPLRTAEGLRTRVRFGDLLITITGANVTKSALVDVDPGEAYVNQHVALVRPVDVSVSRFLHLWTISPEHGRARLQADAYGAGKPGLNLSNIREMPVALPPVPEQREIVRRVEALFAIADTIEKRVAQASTRADRLTQSILARAFRGELVPTEASLARAPSRPYESAQELLGRIRAEALSVRGSRAPCRRALEP